ncbi:MAG TPA: tRNA (adenine-N1)-methyltransferase [Acidimicrobiia bacterium]|nr:tRNA (adenine-N1)-methyltransferase [Acidimicrobiia bacterium]
MSEPFREGEMALVIDGKERHYLVRLDPKGSFQYHRGVLAHSEIIGAGEGVRLQASGGDDLIVLRPRLADYILKMQRGAQVVYPKDIGPILVWGDIGPGMRVLEAGTGSAALTSALVRAVGPEGSVVTVERREDHQKQAIKTLTRWFGEIPANLEMRVGEVEDVVGEVEVDRIVLDLPEPWPVAQAAAESQPGGVGLLSYLPTVPQVQQLVDAMRDTGGYAEIDVFETLHRTWNVKGRSVRPSHQMVGHTGFVVTARRVDRPGGHIGDSFDEEEVAEEE